MTCKTFSKYFIMQVNKRYSSYQTRNSTLKLSIIKSNTYLNVGHFPSKTREQLFVLVNYLSKYVDQKATKSYLNHLFYLKIFLSLISIFVVATDYITSSFIGLPRIFVSNQRCVFPCQKFSACVDVCFLSLSIEQHPPDPANQGFSINLSYPR